ncbi:MAG TPA: hypothetical protein VM681_04230 [Candidatus Thermoplasmatota archaeon]|nr:hypothetical protein [Candidatus Thermoplasmatota archaeon]
MPMIKDAAPPLSSGKIRELRASLAPEYGHTLVTDEGPPVLVVRVPGARPDFLTDVERAGEAVSEELVRAAKDVLLLGSEKLVRVDPIPLRDRIRERAREEAPYAAEMRSQLNRSYGLDILRPGGARGPAILGARIPRARVAELSSEDRQSLAAPVKDTLNQAKDVAKVFLIADEDFRRFSPADFERMLAGQAPVTPKVPTTPTIVADGPGASRPRAGASSGGSSPFGGLISQAMQTDEMLKAKKAAKEGRSAPPPAVPAPAPAPAAAPSPRATTPRRAVPDGPFGGLLAAAASPPAKEEAPTPAPPAPAAPPAPVETPSVPAGDPIAVLSDRFREAGYELAPAADASGFDLAAHKDGGKRLLVKKVPTLDLLLGKQLDARAAALGADAVVVIADRTEPGTQAYALGTRLEIVRAGDVRGLEL